MRGLLTILGVFVLAGAVSAEEVKLNSTQGPGMWTCHVPETQVSVLKEEVVQLRGRTVTIMRVDRNMDGSQDAMFVYDMQGKKRSTFPSAYIYDKDFDGQPDIAYVDEMGNGICQQMHEIPVSMILANDSEREA